MARNGWQWLEMAGIARMAGNGLKWLEMADYGWNA